MQARAFGALHHVLHAGVQRRDDVDVDLQAHAADADGVADAIVVVDQEFLRHGVENRAIGGNLHGLGVFQHALHVRLRHFAVLDGNNAAVVERLQVFARNRHVHRVDGAAGHQLGFVDGTLDRLHRLVHVHHDALADAVGRGRTDADDVDAAICLHFTDDRHDFVRADVQAHNDFFFPRHLIPPFCVHVKLNPCPCRASRFR